MALEGNKYHSRVTNGIGRQGDNAANGGDNAMPGWVTDTLIPWCGLTWMNG